MTNREMFAAAISAVKGEAISCTTDELVEALEGAIAKMDKRNSARSSKPSKTAQANEPIKAQILDFLTGHPKSTANDVYTALGLSSVQKASTLCGQMVTSGVAIVETVKIKGKSPCKAYSAVASEAEAED